MSDFSVEKFLQELEEAVNIDSGSHDIAGLNNVADWFEKKYKDTGFFVRRLSLPDFEGRGDRPYIIAATADISEYLDAPPADEKPIDILFFGHIDTVYPEGTASERPFRIEGDRAYGPGAADMKAGDLLSCYIISELRERYPDKIFAIANNGDEELGSVDSEPTLAKVAGLAKYAFCMEPGRISGNMVKARKDVAELEVIFHGISSHAGNSPQKGASAISEMAHFITEVEKLNDFEKGLTVSAGVCEGGSAVNVISDIASTRLDIRYWKKEDGEALMEKIYRILDNPVNDRVSIERRIISDMPPMELTPGTQLLVELVSKQAEKLGQTVGFESSAGGSDASYVSGTGLPVLDACGPCGDFLHNEKEYLVISSIKERFDLITGTCIDLLERN